MTQDSCGDDSQQPHVKKLSKCGGCSDTFSETAELHRHQRGKRHCLCQTCNAVFVSVKSLNQHLRKHHPGAFRCCDCDRDFINEAALKSHITYKGKAHRRPKDSVEPLPGVGSKPNPKHKCSKCDKTFASKQCLHHHSSSRIHNPLSDIECPVDEQCKRRFTSPSALILHLETGSCSSGMTRKKINSVIQRFDTERIISSPAQSSQTPTLTDTDSSPPTSGSLTPDSDLSFSMVSSGVMTPLDGSSFTMVWSDGMTPLSGSSFSMLSSLVLTPALSESAIMERLNYQCHLCQKVRRFKTNAALQSHLNSAAHEAKQFHCPMTLMQNSVAVRSKHPGKSFKTVSGLVQHLESGACKGGIATLNKVASFVQERLKDLGIKSFQLLK